MRPFASLDANYFVTLIIFVPQGNLEEHVKHEDVILYK